MKLKQWKYKKMSEKFIFVFISAYVFLIYKIQIYINLLKSKQIKVSNRINNRNGQKTKYYLEHDISL